MQEEQRVLQFFMKLNDNFSAIRGNILMMTPMLTVTQAYRLVAQEENHKEMINQVSQSDTMAFVADRRRFQDNYYGSRFQSNTQFSAQRPLNQPNRESMGSTNGQNGFIRRPYFCTHYKMSGHSVERCFKLYGFPPGFKGNKDRKVAALSQNVISSMVDQTDDLPGDQNSAISANSHATPPSIYDQDTYVHALLEGKVCFMSSATKYWFLDSGATDHISPYPDDFNVLNPDLSQKFPPLLFGELHTGLYTIRPSQTAVIDNTCCLSWYHRQL
ncbi:uncharacterized protein LOC141686253 [Apium graveolens]|uniref:uncharacterized protein LOC141686253 n=1 Tax=Apium graveolens TaxID=4045 RepID=UPI003D7BFB39